jgi:PAS domain S-box-containing protein
VKTKSGNDTLQKSARHTLPEKPQLPQLEVLRNLAFDNSLQPNIITTAGKGEIIIVNGAACKLLGYSKKELMTKTRADIFEINESSFKNMLKQRMAEGSSMAFVTAIKKSGRLLPCEITSAVFMDEDKIKKDIITIADMSKGIQTQKNIDIKKEKIVAANILLAKSKQKNIDTKKEKIVAVNISLAKSKQKEIDIKKEKVVAANIMFAQAKFDEAGKTQKSDIGKELHDNVNQLLGTAMLYIEMAQREGENSGMFLSRASEYILNAIEEIRKITKGLTTDPIKYLGLRESINNITRDMMEVNPVKISSTLEHFVEDSVNYKFKLSVFRIIQEELNNILKHAKATEISILLYQNKKSIILSISDNGIGFDIVKKRKGIGVDNIKSRAASYNGTADFVSTPGKGCVLTVAFPMANVLLNKRAGIELIDDKKSRLVEKIKNVIMELAHSDEQLTTNFSDHLSRKFQYGYNYLANLFSEVEGITIEKFFISFKIERVKELILHDGLNLTEIASKLHYSSVAHLSNQFKKITGLTPTLFRQLKYKGAHHTETVGMM